MFSRKSRPVWIGIILLSGMFLTGQETWPPQECIDYDRDGYGNPASESCPNPGWDCNDNNPAINPGVVEGPYDDPSCNDGADNDCDGFPDSFDSGCWGEDLIAPVIVAGQVESSVGTAEVMTLTFSEKVDEASAESSGNYLLNAVPFPLDATLELDVGASGKIVTITAPTGFGVTNGSYLVLANVADLVGNVQQPGGIDWNTGVWFEVVDMILPVILHAYHTGPQLINSVDPAIADDGIWSVGDAITAPDTEVFDIVADINKEIDLEAGISVTYSGFATCAAGSFWVTPTQIMFDVTCVAGTVAAGDSITITAQDLSGNPLSPAIILNAVGLGTNIDPITP
jgi:hypothetical protein